jgi:predicted phosphodiesterase
MAAGRTIGFSMEGISRHNILSLRDVMLALKNIWRRCVFGLLLFTGVVSCDPWFSFSPYDTRLEEESYQALTEENLALIRAKDVGDTDEFKIALLSDPHYHFSKVDDAVTDINNRNYFDFVIVTGDLTDNGLKQEFVFFHESMKNLTIPYITVIGNHDYLANGEVFYSQMYGAHNYSFEYKNVKFVLFDNVRWESEKVPDFEWFSAELTNDKGYNHVIPFSHIPPFDGQMEEHLEYFRDLMVNKKIAVSIHGHTHDFSLMDLFGDGVLYHTISSPQFRAYTELTITPTSIDIQKIEY